MQSLNWPTSIKREILTPKYYNDGIHIALATVAEVDELVSWNFKHIVNFNKIRLFNAANWNRAIGRFRYIHPER